MSELDKLKPIIDEIKADLEDQLDKLEAESVELRAIAEQVIEVGVAVSMEKIQGIDTALSEQALKSAVMSLKAAAGITIVKHLRSAIIAAFKRAVESGVALLKPGA